MGILSMINNAILGRAPAPSPERARAQQAAQTPESGQGLGGAILQMATDSTATAATAAPTATQRVDVEAVLNGISAEKGNPDLNWRSSIVDLMKLIDVDSSLDNRKQLATELGYAGEKDGSAEMNIWLHREVMKELERNGGRVPASLSD